MIIDADLSLCLVTTTAGVISIGPQAETSVAQHISDNVVDLTKWPRNIIDQLYWVFQIGVAITGASAKFRIQLVTSAAVGLGTNQVLWDSGELANATIVAWVANQTIYAFKLSAYLQHRYLGCTYEIITSAFSTGSWRSFFCVDAPYYIAPTPHSA